MAKQERRYVKPGRVVASRDTQTKVHEDTKTRSQEESDALKAELDDLLDEVDGVLEENAEEFVKQYVQKGGQHHGSWHPRIVCHVRSEGPRGVHGEVAC